MNSRQVMLLSALIALPISAAIAGDRYAQLINDFYTRQPPLCLGETDWPVAASAAAAPWESGRLHSLVDAGLAVKRGARFVLTPMGERNWKRNGDLCYGRMAVRRIERVKPLSATQTAVWFTYSLPDREKWASTPSLRHAFSELDNVLSGEKQSLWLATVMVSAGKASVLDYPVPDQLEY